MKVAICGLMPQEPHYHVHSADCADLQKPRYRGLAGDWVEEVERPEDALLRIYPPAEFNYDPNVPGEAEPYQDDVKLFPCLRTVVYVQEPARG